MIQRKMCNNATRKYPKNYDPMARQAQVEMDEVYQVAQAEIAENANAVEFIEDKADVVDTTEATEEQAEDNTLPPFMQAE